LNRDEGSYTLSHMYDRLLLNGVTCTVSVPRFNRWKTDADMRVKKINAQL